MGVAQVYTTRFPIVGGSPEVINLLTSGVGTLSVPPATVCSCIVSVGGSHPH